ncbi:MAG TPA: hypothetical protein VNZ61_20980 [Roseomonas sp.]|nr:hypothetical protein [Roseomonas sp.]
MRDDDKLPGWPRGLTEPLAAAYVGLSVTTFRAAVQAARVEPVWLTRGRKVWLREDLDRWLDAKAGRVAAAPEVNPWHLP